jgi:hypothetical protein
MTPKPENQKTPNDPTPAEEPGKTTRELGEDDLKQVAGGATSVQFVKTDKDKHPR